MAATPAAISPTVSPRMRMAVTAAATWAGEASPRRQAVKKASVSGSVRISPAARRLRMGLKASDMSGRDRAALHARDIQEVGQHLVAAFGGDGLRVELHAVDRPRRMPQAHDLAVVSPGGDFQH